MARTPRASDPHQATLQRWIKQAAAARPQDQAGAAATAPTRTPHPERPRSPSESAARGPMQARPVSISPAVPGDRSCAAPLANGSFARSGTACPGSRGRLRRAPLWKGAIRAGVVRGRQHNRVAPRVRTAEMVADGLPDRLPFGMSRRASGSLYRPAASRRWERTTRSAIIVVTASRCGPVQERPSGESGRRASSSAGGLHADPACRDRSSPLMKRGSSRQRIRPARHRPIGHGAPGDADRPDRVAHDQGLPERGGTAVAGVVPGSG